MSLNDTLAELAYQMEGISGCGLFCSSWFTWAVWGGGREKGHGGQGSVSEKLGQLVSFISYLYAF